MILFFDANLPPQIWLITLPLSSYVKDCFVDFPFIETLQMLSGQISAVIEQNDNKLIESCNHGKRTQRVGLL